MNEVIFLNQNADKWRKIEHALISPQISSDQLSEYYLEIIDDLSYARTFYPDSQTITFLNNLATRLHRRVYVNKKESSGRFIEYWTKDLPAVFYQSRREFFYSLLIFAASLFVGALSAANDANFVRMILGDGYVNMTIANIEKGDPMAVYKKESQFNMFLYITVNNIMVSVYCFAAGILFSFGTIYILFKNGVMIGAFQYFFYDYGLLGESALAVWIHGTIEVSSIIIAGAAGLTMGNSFLFPGTYTRRQSFIRGTRRGLKILVGLVPLFIFAGFLEGFVTRHTGMPLALNLFIILGSLTFVIWYFLLNPYLLHRGTTDAG